VLSQGVDNCCSVLHQLGDVQIMLEINLSVGISVAVCSKIRRSTLCIYTYMCTIHIHIRVYINVDISLQNISCSVAFLDTGDIHLTE